MESQNKSLLELVSTSQNIVTALIENNGELSPELESALVEIDSKLPAKIDSYAAVIERLELESDYWKAKAENYRKVSKGCDMAKERLKDALKLAMDRLGTDELRGFDVKFKLSNSKPKMILDEIKLDKSYFIQVISTEPDKKRIEEDLKLGVPVEGAKLEPVKSLRQYLISKE